VTIVTPEATPSTGTQLLLRDRILLQAGDSRGDLPLCVTDLTGECTAEITYSFRNRPALFGDSIPPWQRFAIVAVRGDWLDTVGYLPNLDRLQLVGAETVVFRSALSASRL
jgi:hypothetical protein